MLESTYSDVLSHTFRFRENALVEQGVRDHRVDKYTRRGFKIATITEVSHRPWPYQYHLDQFKIKVTNIGTALDRFGLDTFAAPPPDSAFLALDLKACIKLGIDPSAPSNTARHGPALQFIKWYSIYHRLLQNPARFQFQHALLVFCAEQHRPVVQLTTHAATLAQRIRWTVVPTPEPLSHVRFVNPTRHDDGADVVESLPCIVVAITTLPPLPPAQ
eukprot:m.165847 g.165847  ORF g.165847 m.165847 type:complete len:217 (-) comp14690_c0_seq4:83-733(-)